VEYRQLGKTDMRISTIALGCWGLVGDAHWGPRDEADSLATARAALDAGINFFDTAEAYGNGESEAVLGRALAGRRHEAIIASKVSDSNLAPDDVIKACERSLRQLNTDYIDLYQIHYANHTIPIADTAGALLRLKEQGKIRAVGVSNFGVQDLADILALVPCQSNQLPYSLIWRAIEYEIVQKCIQSGLGILAYSPLLHGLLTGRFASADEVPEGRARTRHFSRTRARTRHGQPGFEAETFATIERIRGISQTIGRPMAQVAIAWVLCQPDITSVIVGARNPAQVRENLPAWQLTLSAQTMRQLDEATSDLKQKLGTNPDLWQSQSRFR